MEQWAGSHAVCTAAGEEGEPSSAGPSQACFSPRRSPCKLTKKHHNIVMRKSATCSTETLMLWFALQLCDFLETHYLNEQVEAIKKLGDYITNLSSMDAQNNKLAEYLFDKHTLGSKS